MVIPESEFLELKQKAEKCYFEIKKVYCPYFKGEVGFNASGFDHILYKDSKHARSVEDQIMRFRLIKYTDTILRLSGTVQGISDANEWVRLKSHGTWVNKIKRSLYYEFVAVINNYRIKIVIKEDEIGSRSFWSVIPFWRINKNTSRRILHSINLEE